MTMHFVEIPVGKCRLSPTSRPIQAIKVVALAQSIAEVGLRQPINVRPLGDEYEIRGGGHRHAAYVELKRETIPAFVRDDDELHAELAEIDENLVRNELSPAERSIATARRKAIYEALYPETAAGVAGAKARHGSANDTMSFAESTAKEIGRNRRTVEREAKRGEEVGPEQLRKIIGTSLDEGKELDALAQLPDAKREEVINRVLTGETISAKTILKQENRDGRERELGARQRALPTKKYGVIYCDYPRRFNVRSRETGLDRSPENHYPTMTFQEICDLDVPSIAADDCVLFMWSTGASLLDDLEIMAEWGFVSFRPRNGLGKLSRPNDVPMETVGPGIYRSHQIWYQEQMGLGYWFRDAHEILLVGARGNVVAPAPGTQDRSVVTAELGRHSAKPAHFAEMIERLFPTLPKIELFARVARPGWDTWGFEAPESDSSRATEAGQGEPTPIAMGAGLFASVARTEPDDHIVAVEEPSRIEVTVGAGNAYAEILQFGDVSAERLEECVAGLLMRDPPIPPEKITRIDGVTGEVMAPVERESLGEHTTLNGVAVSETEVQRGQADKPTAPAPMGSEPKASEQETLASASGAVHGRSEPAAPPIQVDETAATAEAGSFIPGSIFDPATAELEDSVTAEEEASFFPDDTDTRETSRGDEAAPAAEVAPDVVDAVSTEPGAKEQADVAPERPADNARPSINPGGTHELTDQANDVIGNAGAVGMPLQAVSVSENRAAPAHSPYPIEMDEDGEPIMPVFLRREPEKWKK